VPTLLVFGARNLGRTIAREFAADGWRVAAAARSEETVASFREDFPHSAAFVADATSADEVERVFAEVGHPDPVVDAITTPPQFGGALHESSPDALEPYVNGLLAGVFNVLRIGGRVLAEQGSGTLVQITGGSARRGNPGRGPWAAAAFATRALVQSQAAELRERGVHVALLIVDATIESPKTAERLVGQPAEASASEEEIARAVAYLAGQSPRAWTHELQLTPAGDRWVP
jgi:NAD(P)-dependent dehydrogenase (short-subunit alcohol dehydrogenase family)